MGEATKPNACINRAGKFKTFSNYHLRSILYECFEILIKGVIIFPSQMKLVLATRNKDKCREMTALLQSLPVEVLSLEAFPEVGEIIEDGATLAQNALIKALAVHKITGQPALADDTGLEVDALGGAPGVYTARYAGENCSYTDNVNKLLSEMAGIPQELRTARFRTAAAFVSSEEELVTEGVVKGEISGEAKGVGGFGYDPVFYVPEFNRTFAEINMKEKSQISHRGRAIRKMAKLLKTRTPAIFQQLEDNA